MHSLAGKKSAANPPKKKSGADDKPDGVSNGMRALKMDDTPLPKSKNLNVLNEYEKSKSKKSASFVVVGTDSDFILLAWAPTTDTRQGMLMQARAP